MHNQPTTFCGIIVSLASRFQASNKSTRNTLSTLLIPILCAVLLSQLEVCEAVGNLKIAMMRIPGEGIQPQVEVDDSGIMHMIYYVGEPSAGNLFYVARSPVASEWTQPIQVNHQANSAVAGGTIRGAHMSLGKNGRIHVSWMGSGQVSAKPPEGQHPQAPFMVTRMAEDGNGFELERNVMSWTHGLDGGGSLAADSNGNVYVAWHGRGDSRIEGEMGRGIFLAISRDEGKTFDKEFAIKEAPQGSCACCGMRVVIHPSGKLHIAYRGVQGIMRPMIDLWSEDEGRTFHKNIFNPWEIKTCPMSSVSMLPQENKDLLIGVEQEGMIRVNIFSEDTSIINSFFNEQSQLKGKHPSLASDDRGNILLVWAEGAGWANGGKLRWVILDHKGEQLAADAKPHFDIPVWSFPSAVFFEEQLYVIY